MKKASFVDSIIAIEKAMTRTMRDTCGWTEWGRKWMPDKTTVVTHRDVSAKEVQQLKLAWDALGEIVQMHRIPINERCLKSETVARNALEEMNNLNITAAAEIETGSLGFPMQTIRELTSDAVAAAIEHCAQVAHDWLKHHGYEIEAIECVAAIRKLKDSP